MKEARVHIRTVLGMALLGCSALTCSCGSATLRALSPSRRAACEELEKAKAQWAQVRPEHYRYTIERHCFCPTRLASIEVTRGAPSRVTPLESGGPSAHPEESFGSVDDLDK